MFEHVVVRVRSNVPEEAARLLSVQGANGFHVVFATVIGNDIISIMERESDNFVASFTKLSDVPTPETVPSKRGPGRPKKVQD